MPADIVVLGSSSFVADPLMAAWSTTSAATIHAVSRRPLRHQTGAQAVSLHDLVNGSWPLPTGATVVSLMPITTLVPHLPALAGASRLVALSSTRCFTHAASPNKAERAAAAAIVTAESILRAGCAAASVPGTVLRPTLIYDMARDANVARMARFIARYGCLPIGWPATGLRQPIHAADVAAAILAALAQPAAAGALVNIGGGERLTYRAMAERVFAAAGRRPRFIPIPPAPLRLIGWSAERFGIMAKAANAAAVFARMNQDLSVDTTEAVRLLGLAPRPFRPVLPSDVFA